MIIKLQTALFATLIAACLTCASSGSTSECPEASFVPVPSRNAQVDSELPAAGFAYSSWPLETIYDQVSPRRLNGNLEFQLPHERIRPTGLEIIG